MTSSIIILMILVKKLAILMHLLSLPMMPNPFFNLPSLTSGKVSTSEYDTSFCISFHSRLNCRLFAMFSCCQNDQSSQLVWAQIMLRGQVRILCVCRVLFPLLVKWLIVWVFYSVFVGFPVRALCEKIEIMFLLVQLLLLDVLRTWI